MTAIMEHVKELCEEHSLHYHINNNRVLIDDEFWFYINNQDDINNFNVPKMTLNEYYSKFGNYKFNRNWSDNAIENTKHLFKNNSVKKVLEIGTFEGKYTLWLADNYNVQITTIDPFKSDIYNLPQSLFDTVEENWNFNLSNCNNKEKIKASKIVLAVPKEALVKMSLFTVEQQKALNAVTGVTLHRIYAKYETPWFFENISRTTTDLPLRQFIPINREKAIAMASYSDMHDADFWQVYKKNGTLETELKKQLEIIQKINKIIYYIGRY
jgi:hypothetical protein